MSKNGYDAIVVGARCAGSPTAMLLAQKGYRVLVVDKARFPSDTLSTHMIHQQGVSYLMHWGLLDRIVDAGTPAIERTTLDYGAFTVRGVPFPFDGAKTAFAPRRTLLDKILVDAAAAAGAEVREGFAFEALLFDGDGRVAGIRGRRDGEPVEERATIVIGADGKHSRVAQQAGAAAYEEQPTLAASYFSYWRNLPVAGLEVYIRPARTWGMFPTNDGLTCIALSWPRDEFEANRHDVEGNFYKTLEMAPSVAERVGRAERVAPFRGTGDAPGFFRTPHGEGWALVGDAGYHKDPCTAQGISDGFRDATLLADAVDAGLSGRETLAEALAQYEKLRNEHAMPMYQLTCDIASMQPPPAEKAALLAAVSKDPHASDQFVSTIAGSLPLPEFFAPENVAAIMDRAP